MGSPADDALAARLEALERTVADLGSALHGHADWLAAIQRGADDTAALAPAVSALQGESERATEWLATLERWVRSCVETLSGLGGQPLPDARPGASAQLDVPRSLVYRLNVWIVMRWIDAMAPTDGDALVSVVTCTRGERPAMLRDAVASTLRQSYANLEHVVVDDSPDGGVAAELASAFADERLRVVPSARRDPEGGPGAAFNTGLDHARGEIVAWLDDDNVMDAEWLRSVVWAFAADPGAQCLYGARVVEGHAPERGMPGEMPTLDFQPYDRRRHERANYIDGNAMAWRARLSDVRFDEQLGSAVDWDRSLRLFAAATPLSLPALACYYRTRHPGRQSDRPDRFGEVQAVRRRAVTARPLRVHVHTEMYPVISETYIEEDIRSLRHCGAEVTVSSLEAAVSPAAGAPAVRLDYEAALADAQPDVVLMPWATHAAASLELVERHEVPFACRVHSFDVQHGLVERLLGHPLCIGVFAHPHHVRWLPAGVEPLIPVVGPWTVLPEPAAHRALVMSASAGVPKKRFDLLLDALGRIDELDRLVILARTNGVLDLPSEVERLAAAQPRSVPVKVNVPRAAVLAEMARATAFVYTLDESSVMGFPMSIVEAMLSGAIVIAPDRPEAHEIVGEHLCAYRTADDIVEHVARIAAGGGHVERAREALRQRAAPHRAPQQLRRLHDALRSRVEARTLAAA